MASFIIIKRNICLALIEHGKHFSTAERYIKENFDLSENELVCVLNMVRKNLLPEFQKRWNQAYRKKERFLQKNSSWLDSEYSVNLYTSDESSAFGKKVGRPCKAFKESAEVTQKQKAIKLFRDSGLDHIYHSYIQGLRSIGEEKESEIIQELRSASPEVKEMVHQQLTKDHTPIVSFTNEEALAMFVDLDLTRNQYVHLRKCLIEKGCGLLPSYKQIGQAKEECYPDKSNIKITDTSAKVNLQSLLNHTTNRLLMINSLQTMNPRNLVLYSKWGCDGSSGQCEYKQILSGESELISDANLLISSLVPIRLINEDTNDVIWQNPTPSSVRFCRPISIEFSKETPEKTNNLVNDIEAQIRVLTPTSAIIGEKTVTIKHKLFLTMVDGKVVQVLTNTPSSSTCNVCRAKPSEINDLNRIKQKVANEETYRFGLSTLHAWIRFMQLVLHISYNLSFKKWYATTDVHKKEKETKKRYIQERFRNELGLIIDKPRQGSGNSNDGNTARRFFDNEACTADITGIDEELIRRFHVILQAMSSGLQINPQKFGEYAYRTAELYVTKYEWYHMPSSIHKVLIHGEDIIRYNAILPLGQLSEDAQESRNKDYKKFRLHHARKCSRFATNEDVFHTLLYTSDPYITSLRSNSRKTTVELDEDVLQLLLN